MANTNSDFKSFLANFSLEPVKLVARGFPVAEPLSLTPGRAKRQVGPAALVLALPSLIDRFVETVYELHKAAKGSTVSLVEGDMLGRKLFAVSIYPKRSVELPSAPTRGNLFAFILSNRDLLAKRGRAIGTWFDHSRNVHILDVVICLSHRSAAQILGWLFSQTSIYDLFARREILIAEKDRRACFSSIEKQKASVR